MGGFVAPVPEDAVNLSIQPGPTYNFNTMIDGPYVFGGSLYTVLATHDPIPVINVFKSTDGGLTWSSAIDPGGAPAQLSFESSFDGGHMLNIVMTDDGTTTQVVSFNLNTETWGSPSAAQTPAGFFPYVILSQASGNCVVAGLRLIAGVERLQYCIFSAGVWGALADLDTNALLVMVKPVDALTVFGTVDSSDRSHFIFSYLDNNGIQLVEDLFYQAVSSGGALGAFFQFPDVGTVITEDVSSGFRAVPGILPNAIVVPMATINGPNNELSVYIGTPLASPGWTLHQTIDPGFTTPGNVGYDQPSARLSGGVLRIIYTPDFTIIRVCETTDFVTFAFSNSTVFDINTSAVPPGFVFSGQFVFEELSVSQGTEFTALAPDQSTLQRFFMPFITAGGPVISGVPPAGTVGVPYSFCFTVTGGTAPYTWIVIAGGLPPGLALSLSGGCITGTPTLAGSFPVTVQVTDSLSVTDTTSPTILINPALPSLVIQLIGWKLYPESPCADPEAVAPAPSVKRAV